MVKRALLVMIQPPGCSGVQALIYNKLLPFLENSEWELHFAGPAPELVSVLTEKLDYPAERLHYTTNVSASTRFSIRKNRCSKPSFPYVFFGLLQLLARWLETLTGHDGQAFLLRGLGATIRQAERQWNFDLIAGKSPDFKVLTLVSEITQALNKPFFALIDDPYGARDESGFYPNQPDLQRRIFEQSCGVLFMSPLTMKRYVEAGLVASNKAVHLTDSYPEMADLYSPNRSELSTKRPFVTGQPTLRMLYLGMLPEWRPIEPFLDALTRLHQQSDSSVALQLDIYGYVYPAARQRIQEDPHLAKIIVIHSMVSYAQSHWLAEDADLQLVVIGPRHLDNYPSKFFEYLGHHKPVLVLGPLQNPLKAVVDALGIGLYVDGTDPQAIMDALTSISLDYATLKQAYQAHGDAIEAYSAHRVAGQICCVFDNALARHAGISPW
jgi:glycosyltransferase involved in cell wall biosynthesis